MGLEDLLGLGILVGIEVGSCSEYILLWFSFASCILYV